MKPINLFLQQKIIESQMQPGHVWLAGAGPGDPRYLTVEVLCALSQAEVIVYDALVDLAVLALAPDSIKIFAGKRGGKPSTAQEDISAQLVVLAQQGKRVLRLKGGDPFVFGRAGEEIQTLVSAGIPFRVLPGITSAFAALTRANIPLTMRGINKAIILATGHSADNGCPDLDWEALAKTGQPLIIYMGLKNIGSITESLMKGGLISQTPVAIIMATATSLERIHITTLENVVQDAKKHHFAAPAIFAIGDIVTMKEAFEGAQFQEEELCRRVV